MKWRRAKKEQVFSRWISEHHGALYRHALWMTGHHDLAAEMVQECFYQAWASMAGLKEEDKALPWLLTILRRAIFREQRQQYRHRETMTQLAQWDEDSHSPDTFRLVEIYQAMAALTHGQRETLLLHRLHGFSYEEISRQLDIPLGTVMSRIARARSALREQGVEHGEKVVQLNQVKRGMQHEI